jgi:hypothetical protein
MVNRLHAFNHRDIVRVVKAARAAGVNVDQVTVDPHTGVITVGPAQRGEPSDSGNPWDEVYAQNAKRSP